MGNMSEVVRERRTCQVVVVVWEWCWCGGGGEVVLW